MTESHCGYVGDRDQALIAFLYDEPDVDQLERAQFEAHLASCIVCSEEVAALRGLRLQLGRWAPPEPTFVTGSGQSSDANPQSAVRDPKSAWWREVPAWAQVAAALLFLGVSAGLANLDISYGPSGFNVRTGWMKPAAVASAAPAAAPADAAPWRSDLASLERQMKTDLRAVQASASANAAQSQAARAASQADADVVRRVRALLEDSEKRQQRELALRVAEVVRDVQAQRQADLIKIDRTLGAVENRVGVEVMKDRQRLNTLLVRTSGRQ